MGDDAARGAADAGTVLARLLNGLPAARLAAVAQDVFSFLPLPAPFPWADTRAVVTHIGSLAVDATGTPPLIAYAARLAHEVDDLRSIALNRWIDGAGRSAGLSQEMLRRIYIDSRPSATRPTRAGSVQGTQTDGQQPYNSGDIAPPPDGTARPMTGRGLAPLDRADHLQPEQLRIWGGVPIRNPDFTGRESLLLALHSSLERRSKTSVLPHALHGFGGVGKTQLAVEYAYRYADRYDVVWWLPAEHRSLVLQSLVELGRELGVPVTEEFTQASSLVIDELTTTSRRWLLVYDNANEPDDLTHLIPPPSGTGHVILTSRNQDWSEAWDAVPVNVFERQESVELVRKRVPDVSVDDADRLADRLDDLPLALDQAASWQAATRMSGAEYLTLFDQQLRELTAEGRPAAYPATIAALVRLAYRRLQTDNLAVAQLLGMFAFLGAEPISVNLLQRGRSGRISAPLGPALRDPTRLKGIVRGLRRYGLAKVDADDRIQVHRLFQLVLRDEIGPDQAYRSRHDVHELFASANPGEPDDPRNSEIHAEIGPHVHPAGLIDADSEDARRVVLDQIRYLWIIGDNEGSRRLGETAVQAWSKAVDQGGVGPDGELTLLATRHLSNALLALGVNERARELAQETLGRFRTSAHFGPDHPHTISTGNSLGACLRVAGEFQNAHKLDMDIHDRCRRAFGDEDRETLKNASNVAVDLRMLSRFADAYEIDATVVRTWQETVTEHDRRLLFAQANLARDLYGLGRYTEALALQQRILPPYRQVMANPKHPHVLLAARTHAIALRKTGRYAEALVEAQRNHEDCAARFGQDHQHSLAAAMTYANTLRVTGQREQAHLLAEESAARYERIFGEEHPLSLTATVNLAIVLRELGELQRARELDEVTHETMVRTLGAEHGYTLCAAHNLANDLAQAQRSDEARELSTATLAVSRRSRGEQHPYTLLCAINAAFDLMATGDPDEGHDQLTSAIGELSDALGPEHPETVDTQRGKRSECDIEPPPT